MNIITREIMARFAIDAIQAEAVQMRLEEDVYLDYSEATETECNAAYDEAFALEFGADALIKVLV